jgi:hypothetical protein
MSPPPSTSEPHDPFAGPGPSTGRRFYNNDTSNTHSSGSSYPGEKLLSDTSSTGFVEYDRYEKDVPFDPYSTFSASKFHLFFRRLISIFFSAGNHYTDSEADACNDHRRTPSAESLGAPRMGTESSSATFVEQGASFGSRQAYPAWSAGHQVPISEGEIEDIFIDLTQKFGFQQDSMRNMVRVHYL